jgi:protein-L-isoaspartate(D-aspartate) O-methyltransferase
MGARREPPPMTNERAKRFPLALADLVREPRKPVIGAPGSRAKPSAGGVLRAVSGTGAKSADASGVPPTSKSAAVSKAAAAPVRAELKPVPAAPGHPVSKPLSKPSPTIARPAVAPVAREVSSAPRRANEQRELAAITRKGAPNVALNSSQMLASERVRERMVERLRSSGITDPRVLAAMSAVPRHGFVDPGLAAQAYEDAALPIGHHQTISKPSVVARMIELVAAGRKLDKVLEIGTGCGYQAAVLSQLAGDVYSIERVRPLSERAKLNLRPLRLRNIRLHYGDGRLGLPAAAPFDAIVIACAGLDVPRALLEQLAVGGRLVAPVGSQSASAQVLTLVERVSETQWRESQLDRVFFVPLKSGVI